MKKWMKTRRSQLKLISLFMKISAQQGAAFRFNLSIKLLNTLIMLVGSVGSVMILFSVKESINGWSFYETLMVAGVFMLLQSVKSLFMAPSLSAVSGMDGELWTGHFDFTLLKPVSTQLWMSATKWSLLSLADTGISIGIIVLAALRLPEGRTGGSILLFLLCLAVAWVILYAIMLLLSAAAFWYMGTPLLWILDSLMQLGRYPVSMYPTAFRHLLTWVMPVGLMVTLPAEAIIGRLSYGEAIAAGIMAVVLYWTAVQFLRRSIGKYASASS